MKARASSLPVLQYCSRSREVSGLVTSRSATISSAFHAKMALDDTRYHALRALLNADEYAELCEMKVPFDPEVDGITLEVRLAVKELALGITADGMPCDHGDERAVIHGSLDFAWHHPATNRAYVVDIKRSSFGVADGPESLQLHAYAHMFCALTLADSYRCAIWDATEGEYTWGPVYEMADAKAHAIWHRLLHTAQREPESFTLGSHCLSCYGRAHCPAYLVPPELAETSLAPLTAGGQLTSEKAAEMLLMASRMEETAKKAKEAIRMYARDNVVSDGKGKVYKPVQCKGRVGLNKEAIEADHPGILESYSVRGAAYEQWKWVKP